jgi:transposase
MARRKRTARYDVEFKREAVRLAAQAGRTTKEVAEQLGIHPNQLTKWKRDLRGTGPLGRSRGRTPEQLQIQWLEGELARVREERDILKKAIGIFSKDPAKSSDSSKSIEERIR